jgi:hypothetical protein
MFPPPPTTTFVKDGKLASAIKAATDANSKANKATFPCPFTIVDLGATLERTGAASLPIAGYLDDEEDYIASEAKVGIMYAAYCFRDFVSRFNQMNSAKDEADLFKQLRDTMNKPIEGFVPRVLGGAVPSSHRLPSYDKVVTAKKAGNRLNVEFRADFVNSLDAMIIPSDNSAAMRCVHGLGFSYLNGALATGGFFDDSKKKGPGLWVGGDFQMGKVWAPVRIDTDNDTSSSVGSTSDALARLIAVIITGGVLDKKACDEMRTRLASAAHPDRKKWPNGDQSWLTRDPVPQGFAQANVTHDKIGLGPLNAGGDTYSEGMVLNGVGKSGRNYVVSWQNLTPGTFDYSDVVSVLRDAIGRYE